MTWRKHTTHREESKAVKDALLKAGLPVLGVGHGTGTGWGWLEIRMPRVPQDDRGYNPEYRRRLDLALQIAQEVTGRHGDYNGKISVLQQD